MEKHFRSMNVQMSDHEKLDTLKRNMRGDSKKFFLWKPTNTLRDLEEAGRQIDASNFSLFNKMFGSEKSTNVLSFNEQPPQPGKGKSNPRDQNGPKPSPKGNHKGQNDYQGRVKSPPRNPMNKKDNTSRPRSPFWNLSNTKDKDLQSPKRRRSSSSSE